jgi:RHS repeat-associated protein
MPMESILNQETVSQTINYTYDPLGRLTAADYLNGDYYHYTYDAVGNRLSQTSSVNNQQMTTNYTYDNANRLIQVDDTQVSGTTYNWDDNGNLLSDGLNAYTYDPANRLISVDNYAYTYNGLGDRLQQTVNDQTTNYTLDLNAGLTQVLDDGTNTYLYGVDRIAQVNGENTDYFLGDALGSVRQLTNTNGAVSLYQDYDPYGVTTQSVALEGVQTSYGYTGEAADYYNNLINLRSREYDPNTGRFLTKDSWQGDYNRPLSLNQWN